MEVMEVLERFGLDPGNQSSSRFLTGSSLQHTFYLNEKTSCLYSEVRKQSNSDLPSFPEEIKLWHYIHKLKLSASLMLVKKSGLFGIRKWHYERTAIMPQNQAHFPIFTLSICLM